MNNESYPAISAVDLLKFLVGRNDYLHAAQVRDAIAIYDRRFQTDQPAPMSPEERESVNKFFWAQFDPPAPSENDRDYVIAAVKAEKADAIEAALDWYTTPDDWVELPEKRKKAARLMHPPGVNELEVYKRQGFILAEAVQDFRAQLAAAEANAAKFEKAFEDRGRWLTDEARRRKEAEAENGELKDHVSLLEFRIGSLKSEHADHEQDYLAIYKLIKKPDENTVDAVKRVVSENAGLRKDRERLVAALESARDALERDQGGVYSWRYERYRFEPTNHETKAIIAAALDALIKMADEKP